MPSGGESVGGTIALGVHHDGSQLHLPVQTPTLGERVPVRIRVPTDSGVDRLTLRVLRDAEPSWVDAVPDGSDGTGPDADRFFVAEVEVANPVTGYRILVDRGAAGSSWLNGTGVHDRDVTDQHDFRLTVHDPGPDWAMDATVYQIFPDRFASSGPKPTPEWALAADWDAEVIHTGPDTPRQFFGGDLDGITAHLDQVADLGADTVYLTPIFPSRSNHRYDASTFSRVDPLLGGDPALARLAAAVHGRGMRLIGDLTSNHSGDSHEWFRSAVNDPAAPERGYYYLNADGSYLSWLGHGSLPKFNMGSAQLREIMFGTGESVVARWLRPPYDLDGWRIDVANMTGRAGPDDDNTEIARQIRATIDAVRPGSVLIAEHCHDASGDLTGDGWQGTMNYSGFTRPAWSWLTDTDNRLNFLGVPARIPRRPGEAIVATMRDFAASIAWKVAARQWNLLASHDTPRFRSVTGDDTAVLVGAALQFTYPGTPMIFAGDEIGLTGSDGEHSRTPYPWARPERWNVDILAAYRSLIALRRDHGALRRGGLRWVLTSDDAIGYLRETEDERLLVVLARAPWSGARLPRRLARDLPQTLYGDVDLRVDAGHLLVPAGPAGAHVWRLA